MSSFASITPSESFRWMELDVWWTAHQQGTRAQNPKQELMFKIRCPCNILIWIQDWSFVRQLRCLCLNVSAALGMCHANKLQLRSLGQNSYFRWLLISKMLPVMLFLSKEHTNSHAWPLIGLDQSVQGQGEHSWRSWYNWSLEDLTGRIPFFLHKSCSLCSPFFLPLVSSG